MTLNRASEWVATGKGPRPSVEAKTSPQAHSGERKSTKKHAKV